MAVFAVLIVFLFIVLAVFFFYTAMLVTIFFEAPFVPSAGRAVSAMLKAADIKPGEIVYDLGSGDGRLVRAAARRGARAIGVERSQLLVLWSKTIFVISSVARNLTRYFRHDVISIGKARDDSRFICANFYSIDLKDADVVFTYLFPNVMAKLKDKFEKELHPGSRVVSYAFKVPGWTPKERIQFSPKSPAVYLYVKN